MALVCLGLMALTTVGQTSGKKGTWKLVWQEEFDNKAGFDTTSWSKIPRGTADWNNYMSDFDLCHERWKYGLARHCELYAKE